jgi:hypothetical protein
MTEIKKTKSATKIVPKIEDRDRELEDLKKRVDALTKMLERQSNKPDSEFKKTAIDPDEDIQVISLCATKLNLSTKGFGEGEVYSFTEFGEVQMIPFRDLKDIVRNQKSFLKAGYFYIDSSDALVAMSVNKICESMPDKDILLNLLEKDTKTIIKVLKMMPDGQREMFALMMTKKIEDGSPIDMNVVDACGKMLGRDLVAEAKNRKELQGGGE